MTDEPRVLVDADACPVKEEVYRVAARHEVPVVLVANAYMRIPRDPMISFKIVDDKADAADDYIAETAGPRDVVITADILLAERCIKAGASVLAPNGKPFTEDSIGAAVATRALMIDIRAGVSGEGVGGQPPFSKGDRSRFLQALEVVLSRLRREG